MGSTFFLWGLLYAVLFQVPKLLSTDGVKKIGPKYFITMKLTHFQMPKVPSKRLLNECHIHFHNASFDTFKNKVGRLLANNQCLKNPLWLQKRNGVGLWAAIIICFSEC